MKATIEVVVTYTYTVQVSNQTDAEAKRAKLQQDHELIEHTNGSKGKVESGITFVDLNR